jgi:hypothetical protein
MVSSRDLTTNESKTTGKSLMEQLKLVDAYEDVASETLKTLVRTILLVNAAIDSKGRI